MRITYFYAEHLAGIKVGCKLDTIEIDFSANENPFILLIGDNGSGKSALLSVLHPMRDTNDTRKTIFDKEEQIKRFGDNRAKKIVRFVAGEHEYEALHTWNPNKSFLYKDGECLNDNGSIRSFNELLKQETNLDQDYFKIGRIGSNVKNFIEYAIGERKEYIMKYLAYMDDYLKAFDVVKKKHSMMKKELQNIGLQLDKFPELSTIVMNVKKLTKEVKGYNKSILSEEKSITKYTTLKKQLLEELNTILEDNGLTQEDIDSYDELQESYEVYVKDLETFYNVFKGSKDWSLDDMKNQYSKTDKKVYSLKKDIEVKEEKIQEIEASIDELKHKKEVAESELDEEDIDLQIQNVKNRLKNVKEFLNSLMEDIDEGLYNTLTEGIKENNDDATGYASKLESQIKLKVDRLYNFISSKIMDEYTIEEIQMKPVKNSVYQKHLEELKSTREKKDEISNTLAYIEGSENLIEVLDSRSKNCVDDNCGLIKEAVSYKKNYYDKWNEFSDKYAKLEELEADLVEETEIEERLLKLAPLILEAQGLLDAYHITLSDYELEFIAMDNREIHSLLELPSDKLYETIYSAYTQVSDMLGIIKNEDNALSNISMLKETLQSLSKSKVSQDKLVKEIKDTLTKISKLEKQVSESEEDLEVYMDSLSKMEKKKKLLEELQSTFTSFNEVSELIEKIDSIEEIIGEKEVTIDDYSESIADSKSNLTELKELLSIAETNLAKEEKDKNYIEILIEKKDALDAEYSDYTLIKESLDPKKGIPLVFIKEFFSSITDSTNALLDTAYEGQFSIDFEIDEKSFTIPVFKNGYQQEDITLASQGEISMTSISLYLAMLENIIDISEVTDSKEDYNIIYVDEVDGPLSTINRRLFFEILEKQINRLEVEQTFVITHNNEFYSNPVDLILLDGADVPYDDESFMLEKNIVFSIDEYRNTL